LNIAAIQFPAFKPYQTATVEIYISGCNRKCKGCHNPELHDFNFGKPVNGTELVSYLKEREELFVNIAFLGGDLLCQSDFKAMSLVAWIKSNFNDKKLWLFTGAEKEECPSWVWEAFDVVKIGRFDQKVYNEVDTFPVTANQKVLRKNIDY